MSTSIKVKTETRDRINLVAQRLNMTVDVILGFLLDQNDKYNFVDSTWLDRAVAERYSNILDSQDSEMRKKLEIDRHRTILKIKSDALKMYVLTLQGVERKSFLEKLLGNPNDANFLEKMSSYQLFVIDGIKRFVEPDINGRPTFKGDPLDLVVCEKGYHARGAWCECPLWRGCPIRSSEYETYLINQGTEAERNRYLQDKTRTRP